MTKPLRCKLGIHDDTVTEAWDERRKVPGSAFLQIAHRIIVSVCARCGRERREALGERWVWPGD